MLKRSLFVLIAAGLISVAAPFAVTQDSPSNNPQSSQYNGGRHHGPPDPAEHTRELTKELKLTPDQQTKVLDIFQSAHSQMESLHQNSSLSQEDRRSKMMEIRKDADTQVRALLDPAQQKKWDEMQSRREQRMQDRHPPDAGSGQPPQ